MTYIKDIKDIQKSKKDTKILSFLLKKAERLSSAVYLVTGLMSDSEPLRSELRKKAVKILSDIHGADAKRYIERTEFLEVILSEIDGIKALLSLASTSSLLSEANTATVSREFGVLAAAIEVWGELRGTATASGGFSLAPEFFLGDMPAVQPREPEDRAPQKPAFPSASPRPEPSVRLVPAARREAVLAFLKDHPGSTLKDVREGTQFGTDVSEKTVQRELVSLVLDGSVERSGERRWSRYSLSVR